MPKLQHVPSDNVVGGDSVAAHSSASRLSPAAAGGKGRGSKCCGSPGSTSQVSRSQRRARKRKTSDDASTGGNSVAAHSLAFLPSCRHNGGKMTQRKGVGSPESVVTQELQAKCRAAQKKDKDASTIPKEVQLVWLYHRGKVRTVFGNLRPAGLIYSDNNDNAFDQVDDNEDYVKKNFSSFLREVRSRNCILGGPQRPDTLKMSEKEEVAALEKFKKMRRKYTDKRRNMIAKTMQEADLASSPQRMQMITYSGDQTPSIWLMMVVEAYPLLDGQLFQTKEILMIQIAEEANLRHIKVKVVKSNHVAYIIAGHNFYVAAGVCMESGWLVYVACCREGNDNLSIPLNVH
jgi:hypothetical protein